MQSKIEQDIKHFTEDTRPISEEQLENKIVEDIKELEI